MFSNVTKMVVFVRMVTWEPLEEFLVVECDDVTPCMRKPQQWDTQRQQGHFRTPSFNLNGISFSISATAEPPFHLASITQMIYEMWQKAHQRYSIHMFTI